MENEFGPEYASIADAHFRVKYRASCYCRTVQYEVCADPVDAKICHCSACQTDAAWGAHAMGGHFPQTECQDNERGGLPQVLQQ